MPAQKNNVAKKIKAESQQLIEVVENFTHCYGNLAIKEEAFCPACSIKTKSSVFTLQ